MKQSYWKKKLLIESQAFGVGAFENEKKTCHNICLRELGDVKTTMNNSQMLALPCSDILDGTRFFVVFRKRVFLFSYTYTQ